MDNPGTAYERKRDGIWMNDGRNDRVASVAMAGKGPQLSRPRSGTNETVQHGMSDKFRSDSRIASLCLSALIVG
ncbi:MAG: hypothetical protein WD768_20775 [Phycisphaeraceae bacterium]